MTVNSSLHDSSGRRIEGNAFSGPTSFGVNDSSTVPPVTLKIPMRTGGPEVAAPRARLGAIASSQGNASDAPTPRSNVRRVMARLARLIGFPRGNSSTRSIKEIFGTGTACSGRFPG